MHIEDFFTFHEGDKIVVGCSTGPDSMALLDMLLKIREKYHLFLVVAHVNHNVRKESYKEAEFLKEYCDEHHLPFESMIIENYGDDNFHNEARNIRYHFFESIVHQYGAYYLMTAHHGDDLMETIFMRMVRGSNLNGYSGFKASVDMSDYTIVRPLISCTKKQLEEYDHSCSVPYFVDSSNQKDIYTRNRYRKNLLPFLKQEDKDVHLKFLKFSETLIGASQFIEKVTNEAISRILIENKVRISSFLKEDEYIQREMLYSFLSQFYSDDLLLLTDKHIDLILQLMKTRKANSFVNLPNDVLAVKEYDTLELIRKVDDISSYEIEFDQKVFLPNHHKIEKIDCTEENSNFICRLDSSEISLPLVVRTRKFGDRMLVKGLHGTQKLKNIFIDKKILLKDRDLWPIVVDSQGRIVWIPGIKKSKFDKSKSDKYDIILKYS